ncbi:pituitary tumor-transforming gene 1 protein-interacting protein-like [Branchiostoma floridae]|uniref:Pituitary tumor-transforming gene 1 protein-interacting protein-like n=1 Tax=Branchiostoma floridae TaxID=7739 RepID=A0A9J7KP83_BRAFL|nr:pituitary tumor-transforming gene 1 protein-interacting protein-like [Branchiostoma floridae]
MLTKSSMMSTAESLTTPSNDKDCGSRNSSCVECIGNIKCYYCHNDNTCRLYPASAVLPTAECPLSQVRWGATCDVSFEVLVIAVSVVGAVIVLALCCCCCCCYCRKSQKGGCGGLRCCSCRSCCRSSGSGRHTWRDFKWSRDNRSNQMNPNNWRFWKAREIV